jgi:hypothetical protein
MVGEGDGDRALAAFEQAAALNPAWSGARAWAEAVRERKAAQNPRRGGLNQAWN